MNSPISATDLGRWVISELVSAGVRELVLCPGSRSAPLAFAAEAAAAAGYLRLHTRFDERTAGFLALGLTKVGSRAAVVTTSGTAVANLAPAAWEAAHAGVPVVFVTADRPASLRGTNANQTADQVGVLGLPTVDLHQLGWDKPNGLLADSPTHLNVQFTEPLVPPQPWVVPDLKPAPGLGAGLAVSPSPDSGRQPAGERTELALGPRTVVVAGDNAGPSARKLAESAGWPLLAEPTSGARAGDCAIQTYRLLLDDGLGREVERAVVFGHPTLSRPISRLLNRVEVVAVPGRGKWSKHPFPVAAELTFPVVAGRDDPQWLAAWQRADVDAGEHVRRTLADAGELTGWHVAQVVNEVLPPGGLLVVGASSPIRDLDLMAKPRVVGQRKLAIANRGLAGIDGTLSTAIGAALGRPETTRALALVGDLTFLHDLNALLLGPNEPRPDLTIVVLNDRGGSIFSMLEQGSETYAASYEQLFGLPHAIDLASLCAAARVPHLPVGSLPELQQALASPNGGLEVIEVSVRRDNRRALNELLAL